MAIAIANFETFMIRYSNPLRIGGAVCPSHASGGSNDVRAGWQGREPPNAPGSIVPFFAIGPLDDRN